MKPEDLMQGHWLKRYRLSVSLLACVCVFWGITGIGVYRSGLGDYLEARLAAPLNFQIRELLNKGPAHHPKLKIYVINDKTFELLGGKLPDLKTWSDLFHAVAQRKPRVIVMDAMLSPKPTESSRQLESYFSKLKQLNVPIILGGFTSPTAISGKVPLEFNNDWYRIGHYLPKSKASAGGDIESQMPAWPLRDTWHAYGPAAEIRPWFPRIGHFQLWQDHKIEPFLRLGENLLPHMTMLAATDVQFSAGNLLVEGKRIALDRSGAIDVNFAPTDRWKTRSLYYPLKQIEAGEPLENIAEGDVVLILPLYFTGNTDFRPSPFGLHPGGLYLAAMLNSILSGEWLQPVLAMEAITIVLIGMVGLLVVPLSAVSFWSVVIGATTAVFLMSQVLFSYVGLVLPWLIPILSALAAATHLFAFKMRAHERKVLMLRSALDGAVHPTQLDRVLHRPETVNLEPRERVVTLMFVDVVGFSLSAENMLPRLAFDTLKSILGNIAEAVHENGGVVDKSLGDGLLCYFGYRFDSDVTIIDHAEQALRAAIRIQTDNLSLNTAALEAGSPLYPLRIGINTASCYLGDLGTDSRIEFTVVGNGVNFAKRLESACEMFSILMGSTTWGLVRGLDVDPDAVTRRMIRIKHHKELIDAYDYDPVKDQGEARRRVVEAFRKSTNLQRLNERIPVNDPSALIISCDNSPAIVMNFSGTGISMCLPNALAKGSRVTIKFDSPDLRLMPILRDMGIEAIVAEVRWSYHTTQGFAHGLVFRSLSEHQSDAFVEVISEFAFLGMVKSKRNGDLDKISNF